MITRFQSPLLLSLKHGYIQYMIKGLTYDCTSYNEEEVQLPVARKCRQISLTYAIKVLESDFSPVLPERQVLDSWSNKQG